MTEPEIEQKVLAMKEQLFKIGAENISSGHVDRPHRFRLLKRDIARCYTVLRELSDKKG